MCFEDKVPKSIIASLQELEKDQSKRQFLQHTKDKDKLLEKPSPKKEEVPVPKINPKRNGNLCGYCMNECGWITKKGEAKDNYKCDICNKDFTGPSRYICTKCTPNFNVCSQCSELSSMVESIKCGCGSALEFKSNPTGVACSICNKVDSKGWKCSDACEYLNCKSCKPFSPQKEKSSQIYKSSHGSKTASMSKENSIKIDADGGSKGSNVEVSVKLNINELSFMGDYNNRPKVTYVKGDFIGGGSFGVVRKCTSKDEDGVEHTYAMKTINFSMLTDSERSAIMSEVKIMNLLFHPNIVTIKDYFMNGKNTKLKIIMTYAEKGDLGKQIKEKRVSGSKFKEMEVINIATDIATGLQFMHSHKVTHRDIKPQNVFVYSSAYKIGDFGLSSNAKTLMSTKAGTPIYMAPELLNSSKYDCKVDIWALGCLVYELCTLKCAFEAASINETMHMIASGNYKPFTGYSANLMNILNSMLRVDPTKRASADEVLSNLIKLKE